MPPRPSSRTIAYCPATAFCTCACKASIMARILRAHAAALEQWFVVGVVDGNAHHEAAVALDRAADRRCQFVWVGGPKRFDAARFGHLHGVDRAEVHAIRLE